MILYKVIPYKEEEDCNFSPCRTYFEAMELGKEFYPNGFDIIRVDSDGEEEEYL